MPLSDLAVQLDKALSHLQKQFSQLQAGRASATMVEEVMVESYGQMSPLKNLANISTPDTKTIRIEPWDKSVIGAIDTGLQQAKLGINPQNMGEYILLPIPPMTEDRRKDLVKVVHGEAENARIGVRNARAMARDFLKLQKEEKEVSEDEAKKLEDQIQEKVDEANKKIDELSKAKESDIMTI